jgi:UDP-glucose 4-epimerase
MSKTVLITGGAGYIGSHLVYLMKQSAWTPVILDNFSRGNRDIAQRLGVPMCEGDTADAAFLDSVMTQYRPEAVMHFAALAYVGESVTQPLTYYQNNVTGTLGLLAAMVTHNITKFIFSSTCATYGVPQEMPITESCPQSPVNPYGHTKLMVEQILRDLDHAHGLKTITFRYFNAAGAEP